MKRKILVLFLLCSCLLLLTQKTLAEEVNLAAEGSKEKSTSTDSDRKDVEIESLTTEGALGEESSGDNILDCEQTENTDTEFESRIASDDPSETAPDDTRITEHNEFESEADTLNEEITRAELQTTTNFLSEDKFNRENGFESNGANEGKIAEGKENKDKDQITEELTAELTTLRASETTTDSVIDIFNQTDEGKVTESSSGVTVTEESRTKIVSDPTTETLEESVKKNNNTTTDALRIPTPKLCTAPGIYAVESDCHTYFTCTPTTIGELETTPKDCPTGQAFDRTLLRCSRDLSPCANTFDCKAEGTFADSTDNSSYYWCVVSRLSARFRVYHVKCGNGQIYTPQLGKCFVDMTTLHDLTLNYNLYLSKSPDEECVREEVKIMKAEEKVKLKEAKLREKIQRKYEKELLKKAAKEAKEQAKLQGVSLEEQASFNCTQVGNFATATNSFYDYFVCLSKKGNYKAVGMKCAEGQRFSASKGFCTL